MLQNNMLFAYEAALYIHYTIHRFVEQVLLLFPLI